MDYTPVDDDDIFPKPYEPDWSKLERATSESDFSEAAFYLLKEGAQLLMAIASMKPRTAVTDRKEATLLGLMVKMAKLVKLIVRDVSNDEVEQQLSMSREFVEAAANLLWLIHDDGSGERYAMFIEAGLGAEKNMRVTIDENIRKRGGKILHIEKRMIASIDETVKAGGIDGIKDIRSGKVLMAQGFPKIEQRIVELSENAYVGYRGSSAEVHGTWSDLFKHHLDYDGVEFGPNFEKPRRRPQILTTTTTIICIIAPEYMERMLDDYATQRVLPFFENLLEKDARLAELHERYLEQRSKNKTKKKSQK